MKSILRNLSTAGLICGTALLMTSGAWAADAAAGKATYSTKCKSCHGADGTPPPAMVKVFPTLKPINDASDDAIKTAVTKGTGKMKPVAGIAGADLDNLVAAVHSLK